MTDPTDPAISCDYPAAHSMDTTWFAVDRDGNVAMFETGESGAVPTVVAEQYYPDEDLIEEIGERLYRYEHTCENWISGPYERQNAPVSPVKESAMPDEVLEHAVRFDGLFAEAKELQPAELWACESWQPGWLALDKKTVRPFEGREDELEDIEENIEGEGELEIKDALTGLAEAVRVKKPSEVYERGRAPAYPGDDDWSDVMPPSKDGKPKADVADTENAPPKKPWWKFW